MAFNYKFFNSVNRDRVYYSADWADYFDGLISTGVLAISADSCRVIPIDGMTVSVSAGKFLIAGHMGSITDEPEQLTIAAANSLPRIDLVVARLAVPERCIKLMIIKGDAAESPVPPEMIRDGNVIYDICLARIYIGAGITAISADSIIDTRSDDSVCGWTAWRTGDKLILDGKAEQTDFKALENTTVSAITNSYYINPHNCREEITASGTWTVPDDIDETKGVDVWLVGGGGGGSSSGRGSSFGGLIGAGGSGYCEMFKGISVTAGEKISVIVGAGGAAGTDGGYTQFMSEYYRVSGGSTGTASKGGDGGSGGNALGILSASDISGPSTTGTKTTVQSFPSAGSGRNGHCGCSITATVTNTNLSTSKETAKTYTASGGTGQGLPTIDPYSGVEYARSGINSSIISRTATYGDGGNCRVPNVYLSSQSGEAGKDGIIVIYYSTKGE